MGDPADSRPRHTRSWLHEGTEKTKAKLAKLRAVKAKEELVVEAALAWEHGGVDEEEALLDALSALRRERGET